MPEMRLGRCGEAIRLTQSITLSEVLLSKSYYLRSDSNVFLWVVNSCKVVITRRRCSYLALDCIIIVYTFKIRC